MSILFFFWVVALAPLSYYGMPFMLNNVLLKHFSETSAYGLSSAILIIYVVLGILIASRCNGQVE